MLHIRYRRHLVATLSLTPKHLALLSLLGPLAAPAAAQSVWRELLTPADDSQLIAPSVAVALDTARDRVAVLTGAFDHARRHMEWNGTNWASAGPVPIAPLDGGVAYDRVTHRLLFVGRGVGTETWAYDGRVWSNLNPPTNPPDSQRFQLLWDAGRQRVVWVGSSSATGELGAWQWTGTTWQSIATPLAVFLPSAIAAAYDAARGRLVVVTTLAQRGTFSRLVYELVGGTFVASAAAPLPAATERPLCAFDESARRVVYVDSALAQLRHWDGATWSNPTPTPADLQALADGDARGFLALSATGTLHRAQGARFTTLQAIPWERAGSAIAYDPVYDTLLMFGGGHSSSRPTLADTWVMQGGTWTQLAPASSPGGRAGHAMAALGDGTIALTCGTSETGAIGDAWVFANGTWTRSLSAPTARYGHAMARTLLFGGTADGTIDLDDTWEATNVGNVWRWNTRSFAVRPSPRKAHAMAYDEVRRRTVLFGGLASGVVQNDTWEFDGTAWNLVTMPSNPAVGSAPRAMYFDPVRAEVVMHALDATQQHAAWSFNGSVWSSIVTNPLGFDAGGPMAYVPSLGGAVLIAGLRFMQLPVPNIHLRTFLWRKGVAASTATYGFGCGGARGVPTLRTIAEPYRANSGFGFDLVSARDASPAVLFASGATAAIPLGGGCTLLVDPARLLLTAPASTNGAGFATWRLPIPGVPALGGPAAYAQAFVLDSSGPALGLSATQGLSFTIGN